MSKPTVVTLCGSTRFKQEFIKANFDLTRQGCAVFSVGFFSHADGETFDLNQEEKEAADRLHLAKIDMSDAIFVVNGLYPTCPKCGLIREAISHNTCLIDRFELRPYIGDSTRREIEHAEKLGKAIIYLNPI